MSKQPKMNIEVGADIIEDWGPVWRLGKEMKWVEFVRNDPPMSRKEAKALLEQMDKERHQ